MKRTILTLMMASIMLTGCALLETKSDSVERGSYVAIAGYANHTKDYCDEPVIVLTNLTQIKLYAYTAVLYSQGETMKDKSNAAAILNDMVNEMFSRYEKWYTTREKLTPGFLEPRESPPSKAYCELKLKNIEEASTKIFETLRGTS